MDNTVSASDLVKAGFSYARELAMLGITTRFSQHYYHVLCVLYLYNNSLWSSSTSQRCSRDLWTELSALH